MASMIRHEQPVTAFWVGVQRASWDASGDLRGVEWCSCRVAFADPEIDGRGDVGEGEAPGENICDPVGDEPRLPMWDTGEAIETRSEATAR